MKPLTLLPLLTFLGASAHRSPSRRAAHSHKLSHAPIPSIPGPTFLKPGSKSAFASTAATAPESQKAGARLAGTNITSVSATFKIPFAEMTTTGPTADNENGVYQASYWVGIDGVTTASCGGVSLRAGIDTFWDTGMRSTGAWYEWYPDEGSSLFGNFTVQQGDIVRITTVADADGLGGAVTVEKLDGTGCEAKVLASASHRFEGKTDERLCLGEAAWVIEDYPLHDRPEFPLALANFTEVVFEGVKVNGNGVTTGLEVFDINLEAQGGRLTDCEVVEEGSVDCKRVVGDA